MPRRPFPLALVLGIASLSCIAITWAILASRSGGSGTTTPGVQAAATSTPTPNEALPTRPPNPYLEEGSKTGDPNTPGSGEWVRVLSAARYDGVMTIEQAQGIVDYLNQASGTRDDLAHMLTALLIAGVSPGPSTPPEIQSIMDDIVLSVITSNEGAAVAVAMTAADANGTYHRRPAFKQIMEYHAASPDPRVARLALEFGTQWYGASQP